MTAVPEVTVVIPTHGRPELLARAIRSALAQTLAAIEIVVVLDGEDAATMQVLERFSDSRIRHVALQQNSGGGRARNAGVAAARATWIAFLDDDDEFLPHKLALQLAAAKRERSDATLVVCEAVAHGEKGNYLWPARFPGDGESLSDYLFCRRKLRQGEAFLQTSTYFVSRELATRVPFRADLARHQDWDWLLRLEAAGARVVAIKEPLTIYYHGGSGLSVSRSRGWRTSLNWAHETVLPLSRRAYAFFIATQCVSRFGNDDCWSGANLRELAHECFSVGQPTPLAGALFAMFWLRAMLRSSKAVITGVSKSAWADSFMRQKREYNIR